MSTRHADTLLDSGKVSAPRFLADDEVYCWHNDTPLLVTIVPNKARWRSMWTDFSDEWTYLVYSREHNTHYWARERSLTFVRHATRARKQPKRFG
jgi:hypothetical protein